MADFDKTTIVAYAGGTVTSEKNVGYYGDQNLVLALPFRTGSSGANAFSFLITKIHNIFNSNTMATKVAAVAFAITIAGDETYKNFNGNGDGITYNGVGDGSVTFTANSYGSNYYDISGSVEKKILLPNTDYILWLFPNYTELRTLAVVESVTTATYELSGAAGVVRIKEGDQELVAVPIVKEGNQFIELAATIKQGSELVFCV